jgi:hypothetical protein
MGKEVAVGTVNPIKTMEWVYDVVKNGVAYMAILDGYLVGSIGLTTMFFRYSDDEFLGEQWLFVMPQHRDGIVFQALLDEVSALVNQTGMTAIIKRLNPGRLRGTLIIRPEGN